MQSTVLSHVWADGNKILTFAWLPGLVGQVVGTGQHTLRNRLFVELGGG